MKRIMNEGGLVPYQLTVQVLVNGMIENPSKVSFRLKSSYFLLYQIQYSIPLVFSLSNRIWYFYTIELLD